MPQQMKATTLVRHPRNHAYSVAVICIALLAAAAVTRHDAPADARAGDVRVDAVSRVQGGSFQMGDCWGDGDFAMRELPVHEVRVDDFILSRYEVTVAQFRRFVQANGYKTAAEMYTEHNPPIRELLARGINLPPCWRAHWFEQGDNEPVVMVAWEDAIAYCNWLSREQKLPPAYDEKTGRMLDSSGASTRDVRRVKGWRLPTEAEWEFAARERGRKVRFGNGQNIARAAEINFDAGSVGASVPSLRLPADNRFPYNEHGPTRLRTMPVGSFRPNSLGLHDMSGNAWEWCSDTGGSDYTAERQVNPCATGGKGHIVRGGTWDTDAKACRASARIDWPEHSFCYASGFRIARTVE